MSANDKIKILVAIISAAGVVIAALITGIFLLLAEQIKSNTAATSVAATFVAQRTADVPLAQATYTLPPTFTPLPTQQPYTTIPTPKPNVTVVTPKPITVVATPDSSQQNPPPGSILKMGQSFRKNNITITTGKTIEFFGDTGLYFSVTTENQSNQQLVVIWRNSFVHLKDDKGKEYHQSEESAVQWNINKQFPIASGASNLMPSNDWLRSDAFDHFTGRLDPGVKYLVLTIDQLAGMTSMNWRYDIQ